MRKTDFALVLPEYWRRRGWWSLVTRPLSALYGCVIGVKRLAYTWGLKSPQRVNAPVIVVGNITVGGSGKTPLALFLVDQFLTRGFKPGIVCRGYLGTAATWPVDVTPQSPPSMVGDEAAMMAGRARCPVAAGPDRVASARLLIERHGCDLIISDDGLQHLAMARDAEIAVIDGQGGFGNRLLLPAGPLRERIGRLRRVDAIIVNAPPGGRESGLRSELAASLGAPPPIVAMAVNPSKLVNVFDPARSKSLASLKGAAVHAVAGIGSPQRFFSLLDALGAALVEHAFPDHHAFLPSDLRFEDNREVIMTEKDAVKCRAFESQTDPEKYWYVAIDVEVDAALMNVIAPLIAAPRSEPH